MPTVNIIRESETSNSIRCRQLSAMFDVPMEEKNTLTWSGDLPIENQDWNVGLIVGPSGCGKSTIGSEVFGENYTKEIAWKEKSVIDDFSSDYKIKDIADICQAVGFNTIPAWLRPYNVLSTGEKFRVEMGRRLLELPSPIIVDEFTSVVDRQVAQIGSHAIQKYVRKNNKQFVGISCHYDIIDWLQPDWIFEPATMAFQSRGSLRQRPKINVEIKKVGYEMWKIFSKYHYLTSSMIKQAQCFCLFVDNAPAVFAGVIHLPHNKIKNFKRITRIVTLPDFQGLGLVFVLADKLGAVYKKAGFRLRAYPAHPSLIRALDRSIVWRLCKKPGFIQKTGKGVTAKNNPNKVCRPGAVFEYAGEESPAEELELLSSNF